MTYREMNHKKILLANINLIEGLLKSKVIIVDELPELGDNEKYVSLGVDGTPVSVHIITNLEAKTLDEKEIKRLEGLLDKSNKKLSNEAFINKADPVIVEQEKIKNESIRSQLWPYISHRYE